MFLALALLCFTLVLHSRAAAEKPPEHADRRVVGREARVLLRRSSIRPP
tara:strand:- start:406 stop:552 length:147 start_codon:yes stop_codon:yes gene_type:complete